MQTETIAGQESRTADNDTREEKTAGRSQAIYRVRCPGCGQCKEFRSQGAAAAHQRNSPCPDCDRMMGLSEGTRPTGYEVHLRESEAVAAAFDARCDLDRDDAPSVDEILEAMGRSPDGYPSQSGPTDLTAYEAARCLVEDGEP